MVEVDKQLGHVTDVLEQLAKDLELASVNIQRLLKTQIAKPAAALTWDPTKIKWTEDVGKKGPYEKADTGAEDYQQLVKDLLDHKGIFNHENKVYWLFQDNKTVGRTKPK